MALIPSGTFISSYYDYGRAQAVTRYANGNIIFYGEVSSPRNINFKDAWPKHTDISCSLPDVRLKSSSLSVDISRDATYYYQEIPHGTLSQSYAKNPLWVNGKDVIRQYSPRGNINFRRIEQEQFKSRRQTLGQYDYINEIWASASLSGFQASTYYDELCYSSSSFSPVYTASLNRRFHMSNKFFSENLGEYINPFYAWGSGSTTMSYGCYYDGDKIVNKTVRRHTKSNNFMSGAMSASYTPYGNYWKLQDYYGTADDSTQLVMYPLSGKICALTGSQSGSGVYGLIFNENWSSRLTGSETFNVTIPSSYVYEGMLSRSWTLPSPSTTTSGSVVLNPASSSAIYDNKQWGELWYISGISGTFTIKINNTELDIKNETIIPNVAVLESWPSTGSCTKMASGSWRAHASKGGFCPASYIKQLSSSFLINSTEATTSSLARISYHEFIFNTEYPIVDESVDITDQAFYESDGLTAGVTLAHAYQATNSIIDESTWFYSYQLPLVNFGIDGNIRVLACDTNKRLFFKNVGKKWVNGKNYRVGMFLKIGRAGEITVASADMRIPIGCELQVIINDEVCYVNKQFHDVEKALYVYYQGNWGDSLLNSILTSIQWFWIGSINASTYNKHSIYTIRCYKASPYVSNVGLVFFNSSDDDFNDYRGYKCVNRNLFEPIYHGQLRKKYAGACSFGSRLENFNSVDQNEALVVSASDLAMSDMYYRQSIYECERMWKMFNNNLSKYWYFNMKHYMNVR